ncbi:hypothetical protein GOODEAATRI_025407 [Goodea atripinnis]|uniref:Uncharacterized protein n=1 Tax=Goodea atripinnis TaxID=208336 RepID=A0ABV0NF00_9TELE
MYEEYLSQQEIQQHIRTVNVLMAVERVNASLRGNDPRHTVSCLINSDLQLPEVFPSAATLYHQELQLLLRRTAQGQLHQEELFVAVEMLSAVALINQGLEMGHLQMFGSSLQLMSALMLPSCGLEEVIPANTHRYLTLLTRSRQHKAQMSRDPGAELWLADIQEAVKQANQHSQKALKCELHQL